MLVALVARLPYAMLPLGIMTAFTASSGDLAVGGLASGAFSIAVALCSPLVGRAADIWGQRRVLLALVPANSVALFGLFWAASHNLRGAALMALCVAAGATVVPVGSFTRARWVTKQPTTRVLNAAFSYESMADEMVFVLGPALVGVAASLAAPAAPLFLSFALMLVVGGTFALTSPKDAPAKLSGATGLGQEAGANIPVRPRISRVILAVLPAIIALVCIGTFFGSTQAATTARADLAGIGSQAGLIYAVMGIGSALAALAVVMIPAAFRLSFRFIAFGAGMAITIGIASAVTTIPATTWALAVAGIFVGPTLVTAFSVAEALAPTGGISVAMTLMQSSVTVGVSLGSAAGGAIAQSMGATPAFLLAAVASALITVVGIALLLPRYRRKHGAL